MMHPRATRSGTTVRYRRAKGDANETFNGKRFIKTLTHVRAYQAEAR
jgi:hypothetical protein